MFRIRIRGTGFDTLSWCSVYPASVYIILFGLSLAPFVDLLPGSQGRVKIYKDKAGSSAPDPKLLITDPNGLRITDCKLEMVKM